jgi:hypothetical protein
MGSYWFAAVPSKQERTRSSLNFGLGRAERLFNERVVPGFGRVWFVDGERILGKRAFGRDADDGIWAFDKLRTTKHYVSRQLAVANGLPWPSVDEILAANASREDAYVIAVCREVCGPRVAAALAGSLSENRSPANAQVISKSDPWRSRASSCGRVDKLNARRFEVMAVQRGECEPVRERSRGDQAVLDRHCATARAELRE